MILVINLVFSINKQSYMLQDTKV